MLIKLWQAVHFFDCFEEYSMCNTWQEKKNVKIIVPEATAVFFLTCLKLKHLCGVIL